MKIKLDQDIAALRRAAYEAQGLTFDALTVALIEDDRAEIARIRAERAAIKAQFPKKGRK